MGRLITTASSCIQAKMFPIFSVVLLASCLYKVDCQRPPYPPAPPPPPPPQYPTPSPVQDYNPDIGQSNVGGYGVNKDPYCHKVEEVIFENKCEPYTEKTCWTQNQETCQPELFKNCTGVIETNIERVCFNVNELVCSLVEAVHYETLEETYQVQRCFTGKDRVCDTTSAIDTTKDDYQCCNVETPTCYMEEKTINDVTCTNTVEFNCKREKTTKNDGYGQKRLFVRELQSKIAITSLERSKWRCARPMSTDTARSFPTSSPSPLKSRIATLSPRRSASWR